MTLPAASLSKQWTSSTLPHRTIWCRPSSTGSVRTSRVTGSRCTTTFLATPKHAERIFPRPSGGVQTMVVSAAVNQQSLRLRAVQQVSDPCSRERTLAAQISRVARVLPSANRPLLRSAGRGNSAVSAVRLLPRRSEQSVGTSAVNRAGRIGSDGRSLPPAPRV